MDEKKIFDLLEKIYIELQNTKGELRGEISDLSNEVAGIKSDVSTLKSDFTGLKSELEELKSDVKKLGAKIDGEITNKLKTISEEQYIMKNDIKEIKEHQHQHDIKFEDLKIAVDSLTHKQIDQEKEIWELRKVK